MDIYEILTNGTCVKIHAEIVEEEAIKQIKLIASHPAIIGLIAIMPDVHAGAGSVVGFTGRFKKAVIPNLVGVDIGCGVLVYRLKIKKVDFAKLDAYIRKNIPLGFKSRPMDWKEIQEVFGYLPMAMRQRVYETCLKADNFLKSSHIESKSLPIQQIGTLGGGNHFIELDKGNEDELFLTIHSGSRNFGLKLANYYQNIAKKITEEMNIKVPKDLEYLPFSVGGHNYLDWLMVAQDYAQCNRLVMLNIILKFFGEEYNVEQSIESVHNYISGKDGIVRKGAISAYKNEKVVIPLHMGAGIVIGTGKGNKDYNYSAPHGAGRLYGRKDMVRRLYSGEFHSMEEFVEIMRGIYTTSISINTFDESPFAYKSWDNISRHLEETVNVIQIARPVYNLKSPGESIKIMGQC